MDSTSAVVFDNLYYPLDGSAQSSCDYVDINLVEQSGQLEMWNRSYLLSSHSETSCLYPMSHTSSLAPDPLPLINPTAVLPYEGLDICSTTSLLMMNPTVQVFNPATNSPFSFNDTLSVSTPVLSPDSLSSILPMSPHDTWSLTILPKHDIVEPPSPSVSLSSIDSSQHILRHEISSVRMDSVASYSSLAKTLIDNGNEDLIDDLKVLLKDINLASTSNMANETTPLPPARFAPFFKLRRTKNPKAFQCHFCEYTIGNRTQVVQHLMRRHLSYSPYHCHTCSASFCRQADLKKHEGDKHSGVKFLCSCGRQYTNARNRQRHQHRSDDCYSLN